MRFFTYFEKKKCVGYLTVRRDCDKIYMIDLQPYTIGVVFE